MTSKSSATLTLADIPIGTVITINGRDVLLSEKIGHSAKLEYLGPDSAGYLYAYLSTKLNNSTLKIEETDEI